MICKESDAQRHANVVSAEDCKKLIELGEKRGFPFEYDSPDAEEYSKENDVNSQSIDVYDKGHLMLEYDLWETIEPHAAKIQSLFINQRKNM